MQPRPPEQAIAPWLQLLSQLMPPTGVLLVGAGNGAGPWVQLLQTLDVPSATLVEADDTQFEHLQRSVPQRPGWRLRKQVVGPRTETVTYYQASNAFESGLLAPESLRSLWPNLKTAHKQTRQAIALAELQQDADPAANWLLLDCLPALPILQGAAQQLAGVDVIAVRVLLNASAPEAEADSSAITTITTITTSAAAADQLQPALQALGFRCLAIETSRHPALGHALFVRDTAAQASQLQHQLSQQAQTHQEQTQAQAKTLAQALAQAKATAEQLAAEHQQQAEECAAQVQQLSQAKAAAEKLATERQEQLDQLQTQLKQVTEQAKAAAQEAEKAKTAAKKAEERATQLSELTQAAPVEQEIQNASRQQIAEVKSQIDANCKYLQSFQDELKKQSIYLEQIQGTQKDQIKEMIDLEHRTHLILEKEITKQSSLKEDLKDIEKHVRNDINKGLANAVRQVESFISIQTYFQHGESTTDFHGWPISADLGLFLLQRINEKHYDLIIEFGSGTSTALFAKGVDVKYSKAIATIQSDQRKTEIVSFEHDLLYHNNTLQTLKMRGLDERVDLVHAPLIDWQHEKENHLFYDCQATLAAIALRNIDRKLSILVLVDGPPGATCANARYPAVPIIFSTLGRHQIDVVLDDASRPEEKAVIALWQEYWKQRSIRMDETHHQSEKGLYFARSQH